MTAEHSRQHLPFLRQVIFPGQIYLAYLKDPYTPLLMFLVRGEEGKEVGTQSSTQILLLYGHWIGNPEREFLPLSFLAN